jgi:hypothetical protein
LNRTFIALLLSLLWLTICTILLTIPGNNLPSEHWIGIWAEKIQLDKWVHVGLFTIMVILWSWTFSNKPTHKKNTYYFYITILWIAYGIGMEYVQKYFVVNRSFDRLDMLADAAGAFIGYFFSKKYFK